MSREFGPNWEEICFVDVEAQPREPGFMREIGQRLARGDALLEQPLDVFDLRRGGPPPQQPCWCVVRKFHRVINQRGGLVARIVGAVSEEHARALEATLDAEDESGCV